MWVDINYDAEVTQYLEEHVKRVKRRTSTNLDEYGPAKSANSTVPSKWKAFVHLRKIGDSEMGTIGDPSQSGNC